VSSITAVTPAIVRSRRTTPAPPATQFGLGRGPWARRRLGVWGDGWASGVGRGADRRCRGCIATVGAGVGRGRCGGSGGHAPVAAADRGARGHAAGAGGQLLRGERAGADRGAGRRADRGPDRGRGDRRRDAERERSRVPAGGRGSGGRGQGDLGAGPVGGADRARGVGLAGGPVLLRGVPAAEGGRAVPRAGRPGCRAPDDGVLRGTAPAGREPGCDRGRVRGGPACCRVPRAHQDL
jgi:hypothetical protein